VTLIDQEDHARGARVEIALLAAQRGELATAAGILAGMSGEERQTFGPLIAAALRQSSTTTAPDLLHAIEQATGEPTAPGR
jgi:ABC-type uncharacterized transport system ATPase subunit